MNVGEISQRMASDAARIAEYLLPQGKKAGKEWKVGGLTGEPGSSLSVCTHGAKAGVWKDFQADVGGDLVDLWAAVRGQTIAEAMVDIKSYLGISDTLPQRERKEYTVPAKPKGKAVAKTEGRALAWLLSRGLTVATIEAFKVVEQTRGDKVYALFPYLTETGEYVNGKTRNIDDKKDMRQEAGAMPCLFGWHLIDPKARTIAIAEGELDAMSLHQVGIPALSVNAGAGNHQWIDSDWDRLERFSEILVFFDCDEAGEKGARDLRFELFAKGLAGGSEDVNQNALLGRTYDQGILDLGAKADAASTSLRSSDETTRLNLLQGIDNGMDQGSVLSSAANQLANNSKAAAAEAQGTSLGDLFASAGLLNQRSQYSQGKAAGTDWWNSLGQNSTTASRKASSGIISQA